MQEVLNLLWSINDRLAELPAGARGVDFDPPTLSWLNDVIRADRFIAREIQKAGEEHAEKVRRQKAEARRHKGRRR